MKSKFHVSTPFEFELSDDKKLTVPKVTTTNSGLHSFSHFAVSIWNCVTDDGRAGESLVAVRCTCSIRGCTFLKHAPPSLINLSSEILVSSGI